MPFQYPTRNQSNYLLDRQFNKDFQRTISQFTFVQKYDIAKDNVVHRA